MNLEAECEMAEVMIASLGSLAAQRASDHANRESLNGNHDRAADWRRILAFILAGSPMAAAIP